MSEEQDITVLDKKLDRLLRRKSSTGKLGRSLSGLYKAARNDPRVSMIGDYLILAHVLFRVQKRLPQHKWSRQQFYYVLKTCRFWEEEGRKQAYIPEEWRRFLDE